LKPASFNPDQITSDALAKSKFTPQVDKNNNNSDNRST